MLKEIKNNPNYLVNESGMVWSRKTNQFIKPAKKNSGYLFYKLFVSYDAATDKRKYNYVHAHRIVAEAFIDNPSNLPCVNHIDGNKENNHVSNLEWVSYKNNMVHAVNIGLFKKDIKVTDLEDIFNDFVSLKFTMKELEEKYNWHSGYRISRIYLKQFAKESNREDEYERALLNQGKLVGKAVKAKLKKPVLQLSLSGQFIKEWDCINDAAKALNIRQGCISNCCSGRSKSSGGFKWEYK